MKYLLILLLFFISACGTTSSSPGGDIDLSADKSGIVSALAFEIEKAALPEKFTSRKWTIEDGELNITADLTGDGRLDEAKIIINYVEAPISPKVVVDGALFVVDWPFDRVGEMMIGDVDADNDADIVIGQGENIFVLKNATSVVKRVALGHDEFVNILVQIDRFVREGEVLKAYKSAFDVGLGTSYSAKASGEGPEGRFDRDPEVDLNSGNCVTWVEQTLAMVNSGGTYDGFLDQLRKIRYKDGDKKYEERNHFQEADWIPNNVGAGYATDILSMLLTDGVPFVQATTNKKRWYEAKNSLEGDFSDLSVEQTLQRIAELKRLGSSIQPETTTLGFYPFEQMVYQQAGKYYLDPVFVDALPEITIFNIVNMGLEVKDGEGNWITDLIVSHVGFIVKDETGNIMIYHSTNKTDVGLALMSQEDLLSFLSHRFLGNPDTKAVGLNLIKPKI